MFKMTTVATSSLPHRHDSERTLVNSEAGQHDVKGSATSPTPEQEEAVPFTLTLQEEKANPGQFRLVVNLNPDENTSGLSDRSTTNTPQKLHAKIESPPGSSYGVSSVSRTNESVPLMRAAKERQQWSNLDSIPPNLLQSVIPEGGLPLENDAPTTTTMATQPSRLSNMRARIKKNRRGFAVRLLKATSSDAKTAAELDLEPPAYAELDSTPVGVRVELDGTSVPQETAGRFSSGAHNASEVVSLETLRDTASSENVNSGPPLTPVTPIMSRRSPLLHRSTTTQSLEELRLGDAETPTQDVRSVGGHVGTPLVTEEDMINRQMSMLLIKPHSDPSPGLNQSTFHIDLPRHPRATSPERKKSETGSGRKDNSTTRGMRACDADLWEETQEDQGDTEPFSRDFPPMSSRSVSVSSISSTPTRGLSIIRPVPTQADTARYYGPIRTDQSGHASARGCSSIEPLDTDNDKKRLRLCTTDVPGSSSESNSPVLRSDAFLPSSLPQATMTLPSGDYQRISGQSLSPVKFQKEEAQELPLPLKAPLQQGHGSTEQQHISGAMTRAEKTDVNDETGAIPLPSGFEIRQPQSSARSSVAVFAGLTLAALAAEVSHWATRFQEKYGNEPPIPEGHLRVRWTCSCGEQLYDDFIERRQGAARLLEAYLNRPMAHTPTSPNSSPSSTFSSSMFSGPASSTSSLATPPSTYGGGSSWDSGHPSKHSPTKLHSSSPLNVRLGAYPEPQWLLTCANEGRYTPKVTHLDVNAYRIRSDRDFAMALREYYDQLNRKWFRSLRLRGLTTISFVQFEVHRNRFADIRKCPDMPPAKADYDFEAVGLVPPVGSQYLLHLFKHPEDYDSELIAYLRSPKRRGRLDVGIGWGINLVEGFLPARVWTLVVGFFTLGSLIFAVVWACMRRNDMQGAFGVASWLCTLAALAVGWAQACLD